MKQTVFLVFCLFAATAALAQSRVVTGHVTDEHGGGLPGVSVKLQNTAIGTFTNTTGDFSIKIPTGTSGNPVLEFSYVNYGTQSVTLQNDSNTVKIAMQPSQNNLNDVVVVGYGTVLRKNLTGAVSTVNANDLKDIPINSAEEALAGRLAGVQVTGSEGSPGAEVNIVVRGGGSITQSNAPLYVVDGMIEDNALQTLAPQDIQSIDVLKDASATAIYGARGANGVVVITTKLGNTGGRTLISYNGLVGVQNVTKTLPVLDPYDYVFYQYERDYGNTTSMSDFTNTFGAFADIDLYKTAPFINWQKQVFGRNAPMQTHNVSLSGGNDKTQFHLSVTDNATQAVMVGSSLDRQVVNFQLNHQASDRLKVGFNVRFTNQVVDGQGTSNPGSSGLNFLRQTVRYMPYLAQGQTLASYDAAMMSNTNSDGLYLVNPLLLIQAEYQRMYQMRLGFTGFADLKLTDWLSFRSTFGYDTYPTTQKDYDDSLTSNSILNGNDMPIAVVINAKMQTLDNSNVFTVSNRMLNGGFNRNNKIDWVIGQEIYQTQNDSSNVTQRYFPNGTTATQALNNLSLASPPSGYYEPSPTTNSVESRILSFFTRVNYALDNKYLATVSLRADGSSLFAPGHQWGYFPAASAAWRISEEHFMQSLKSVISDAKLRVSYGEAGNNRIPPFLYLQQFVTNNGNPVGYGLNNQVQTGFAPATLANADLKWESVISRNVGLDLAFLNNRITFSTDYYRNTTHNLLVNVTVPSTSGYTTQMQNVGSTANNGIEFQVGATAIQSKNFKWNINFNISANKNKVLSLGNQQSFFVSSGWSANSTNPSDYIVKVGAPVGSMYGLVSDGYYQISDFTYNSSTGTYTLNPGIANDVGITGITPQPGSPKFKDLHGNGVTGGDQISLDSDQTIIGNANPKFFGGINQQFTYKNFDMSIFLNFQYGNNIINDNKLEFTSGYTEDANLLAIEKNAWTNMNQQGQIVTDPTALAALNKNATLPTPLTSSSAWIPQSWAVENGSYLRINNITLGYSLPQDLVKKAHLQRFRMYVTLNNLAVITSYSGYDPEVNTRRGTPMTPGVDFSAYPRARSYIFGLNVTF